jgi:YHS domain-containing protein
MKLEFIRCEFCEAEIASEACKLAAYKTTIDGKEVSFCCSQCAVRYKQKKRANKK